MARAGGGWNLDGVMTRGANSFTAPEEIRRGGKKTLKLRDVMHYGTKSNGGVGDGRLIGESRAWGKESPCEEALVRDLLHDLLLQSSERAVTLAVKGRHVDVEDTQQRVRSVFLPCRLTLRGPREPLGNAEGIQWLQVQKGFLIYVGNVLDKVYKSMLRCNGSPVLREEFHSVRSNEFLERPSTSKPPALVKGGVLSPMVLSRRDVGKICVAHRCEAVPLVHGVYGLRELGAARFVDTA